ncbi:MAG: Smr/MutS family protein [Pseudoruegeria sp.]
MSRKPRHLSNEEKELWRRVTEKAEPIHQPKPFKLPQKVSAPIVVEKEPDLAETLNFFEIGQRAKPQISRNSLKPSLTDEFAQMPVAMDKKAFGRLKKGKLVPDSRIDLHGMTLAQAHPALIGFIRTAQVRGYRLVLVITGKGKQGDDHSPIPRPRGVLKHQVPQWLRAAPLAPMILQISEAHLKHGGSGAYYVYLRRTR